MAHGLSLSLSRASRLAAQRPVQPWARPDLIWGPPTPGGRRGACHRTTTGRRGGRPGDRAIAPPRASSFTASEA